MSRGESIREPPNSIVQAVIRLFREAHRRKVFRTGALYVVGAWLGLQVADVTFPGFGIPEAAIQALVWAAVLGLPVALAFGWLFEIGPDGIHRTAPAEAAEPQPLARRDYLVLAAFAAIAVVLVYRAAQDVRGERGRGGFAIRAGDRHERRIGRARRTLAAEQFHVADDLDAGGFRQRHRPVRLRMS